MIKTFVIGWPIAHSLSPQLHGYWLKYHNICGSYEKLAVAPEDLESFLNEQVGQNFVGGNVTLPHKETIFTKIADRSPVATKLMAANTIWMENGTVRCDNTDGYGFTGNLDDFSPNWRRANCALALGAGGASKAICLALINAGIKKVFVVNRNLSRAVAMRQQLGHQIEPRGFDELPKLLGQVDLLINTTSLGMVGQPPLEIDLSAMASSSIVTDIVYNPLETDLLTQAKSRNLLAVDGIGMLLHQAVPGFEKWFGVRPSVTAELRKFMIDQSQAVLK